MRVSSSAQVTRKDGSSTARGSDDRFKLLKWEPLKFTWREILVDE